MKYAWRKTGKDGRTGGNLWKKRGRVQFLVVAFSEGGWGAAFENNVLERSQEGNLKKLSPSTNQ